MTRKGIPIKIAGSRWERVFSQVMHDTGCKTQKELATRCLMTEDRLSRLASEKHDRTPRDALELMDAGLGTYPGWTCMLYELCHNRATTEKMIDLHLRAKHTPAIMAMLLDESFGMDWFPLVRKPADVIEPEEEIELYVPPWAKLRPTFVIHRNIGYGIAAAVSNAPPAHGDLVVAEIDGEFVAGLWYKHGDVQIVQDERRGAHYASDRQGFGNTWLVLAEYTPTAFKEMTRRKRPPGGTSAPEPDPAHVRKMRPGEN